MGEKVQKDKNVPDKSPGEKTVPEGFEEVGPCWDDMYLFKDTGDIFQGTFIQTVPDVGPNKSNVHVFQREDERIGIWGSILLDNRIAVISPDTLIHVVYNGDEVSDKSGREYKSYSVYRKKGPLTPSDNPSDDVPF